MIDHAKRINRLKEIEAENKLMEAMEAEAAPALYTILFSVILASVGAMVNIAIERGEYQQDAKAVSEAMALCANGKSIAIDNALMTCKITELVAMK